MIEKPGILKVCPAARFVLSLGSFSSVLVHSVSGPNTYVELGVLSTLNELTLDPSAGADIMC